VRAEKGEAHAWKVRHVAGGGSHSLAIDTNGTPSPPRLINGPAVVGLLTSAHGEHSLLTVVPIVH
jgi:hypothetical protein